MASPEDLGRYRLKRLLGRGALGQVWEAVDGAAPADAPLRKVAMKIMNAADEELTLARLQFAREARLAGLIRHPHVARIHDAGEAAGTSFMVMEYAEGASLRARMRAGDASVAERLGWLRQIGAALAALHEGGLAHRDLKPENVIIRPDGTACVVDLGMAKWRRFGPRTEAGLDDMELELDAPALPPSAVYAPPETLETRLYDELGDQYAWATLAYELLTGELPREGSTPLATREGLSAGMAAAVERARAPRREDRWPAMEPLLEAMAEPAAEAPDSTEAPSAEAPPAPGRPSLAPEGGLWCPTVSPMPFVTRLWFAWVVFFKVLFDGLFAAKIEAPQLEASKASGPEEPAAAPKEIVVEKIVERVVEKVVEKPQAGPPPTEAALQLLALLQREGRLVDFLEEDVASFSDADIGAAARVVHSGCRKALREHVKLEPVRAEDEGAKVTLAEASPNEVKLTGNVSGKGPHTGVLRHRGWRAVSVQLPTAVDGHDAHVVAQAEVEL